MNEYKKAVLAILAVDVFWAINTIVSKIALEEIPLLTYLGLRSLAAAVILGFLVRKSFVRPPLRLVLLALIGGPLTFYGAWYGISTSSATSISLVGATDPSLYFFFSMLFLNERFNSKKFAGVILVVSGVAVGALIGGSGSGESLWYGPLIYFTFLGLGTLVNILIKRMLKSNPLISTKFVAWLYIMLNAIVLLPIALYVDEPVKYSQLSIATASIWVYSVISLIVALGVLFFYAVKRIDGEDIGLFRSLEPILVALGGIFILGEVISWHFWLGASLVVAGLFIAELHVSPYRLLKHMKKH